MGTFKILFQESPRHVEILINIISKTGGIKKTKVEKVPTGNGHTLANTLHWDEMPLVLLVLILVAIYSYIHMCFCVKLGNFIMHEANGKLNYMGIFLMGVCVLWYLYNDIIFTFAVCTPPFSYKILLGK